MKSKWNMLHRATAYLLAVVLLALLPDSQVLTSWATVATPSNANSLDQVPHDRGNGPRFDVVQYEQSFIDYPLTLRGVRRQRTSFASGVLDILVLILAACGVSVSPSGAGDIFSGFDSWLRKEYADQAIIMETWQNLLKLGIGATLMGMEKFIPVVKEYLTECLSGYGTGSLDLSVTIGKVTPITTGGTYLDHSGNIWTGTVLADVTAPIYCYVWYRGILGNGYYSYTLFLISKGSFSKTFAGSTNPVTYYPVSGFYGFSESGSFKEASSLNEIASKPYSIYMGLTDAVPNILVNPDFVLGETTIPITPDRVWTRLQEGARYGDALTLPQTEEEWAELKLKLALAPTALDVSKILSSTIAIDIDTTAPDIGTDDDVDDKVYPWFPSLDNWLSGISGSLDGLKNGIKSIPNALAELKALISTFPQTLTDIKNSILSVPQTIINFFTLDMAVISAAFAGLQDAFQSKFSGIGQLASIFNRKYSFNMNIPVIKMAIPAELRVMFDGKTEIVFLDLNPFRDHFSTVRGLLVAMLWVSFAHWLLDEFDVKINIG